jgi:hypothetical protein
MTPKEIHERVRKIVKRVDDRMKRDPEQSGVVSDVARLQRRIKWIDNLTKERTM